MRRKWNANEDTGEQDATRNASRGAGGREQRARPSRRARVEEGGRKGNNHGPSCGVTEEVRTSGRYGLAEGLGEDQEVAEADFAVVVQVDTGVVVGGAGAGAEGSYEG